MKFIRKIAPFLLLSIFSLTQLHAILPHTHHDHTLDANKITKEHHHHIEHSEAANISDTHKHEINLIEYLFERHSHNIALKEDVTLYNFQKQKSEDLKVAAKYVLYKYCYDVRYITKQYRVFNHIEPERKTTDFLCNSYSLRGPPSFI